MCSAFQSEAWVAELLCNISSPGTWADSPRDLLVMCDGGEGNNASLSRVVVKAAEFNIL